LRLKLNSMGDSMRHISWLVLLLLQVFAHAEVYKWTDANGQVQFSDRPPPQQRANAKVTGVQSAAGPVMERVCASVAEAVPQLMAGLRKSMSAGEAHAVGQRIDSKLAESGMDDANFKRLLGMLYSYQANEPSYVTNNGYGYYSSSGAQRIQQAQLEVKNACLAGRFGRFDAIKEPVANSGESARRGAGTGTGFWVDSDRIATSWHVVKGATSIRIIDAKGEEREARVVSQDVDNDVAVLSVFGAQWPSCLRLASAEAGLGAEVFTVGFPQTEILGVKPKLATGVISSRFGMRDDPRTYQISVPVQAGNSGGPLLNMQGEVVGVVAAKLNAAQVFNWTGDLPQNVNYAVKSKPLSQLVGAVTSTKAVLGKGAESLAPQVEMAVVLIRVK
jgi:S1-C subfamily serine protease